MNTIPLLSESVEPACALSNVESSDLPNLPPIDHRRLLDHCVGKPTFAVLLLDEFSRTANRRLEEFERQSDSGNCVAVAELSHALKGVADILCASTLHEITDAIETACQTEDLVQMRELIGELREEMARVQLQIPCLSKLLVENHD